MPIILRKSPIDSALFEVVDGDDVVREIPVSFSIYKWPRQFASLQELEGWLKSEEGRRAKQAAFRLLNSKTQTTSELKKKLLQRGFSQAVVEELIEELKRLELVNDSDYCKSLIEKELRRGHGPQYIEMKLRFLGLDSSQVRRAITDEMQREAIRKLIPRLKNPSTALQRRGFHVNLIVSELKNFTYRG